MHLLSRFTLSTVLLFLSSLTYGQFAGGTGTAEDPWQVATLEHLNNVRNYLGEDHADKHFIQIADINATGLAWQPIGSLGSGFMGTYNGDDHKISNLNIIRPEAHNTGLFGYLENARISNLNLQAIEVAGNSSTGSLAGRAHNSFITNVTVTGTITGTSTNTGGIIGYAQNGQYSRLAADVTVTGTSGNTGGVFGTLGAEARYSYSKGTVVGTTSTGGFVGLASSGNMITDCYSLADVTGTNWVGGFSGWS